MNGNSTNVVDNACWMNENYLQDAYKIAIKENFTTLMVL
jgi:hypothetical protein